MAKLDWENVKKQITKSAIVGFWVALVTFLLGIAVGLINKLGVIKISISQLFSTWEIPLTTSVSSKIGNDILQFFNGTFGVNIQQMIPTILTLAISAFVIMLVGGLVFGLLEKWGILKIGKKPGGLALRFFLRLAIGSVIIALFYSALKIPFGVGLIGFLIWALVITLVFVILGIHRKNNGILDY